MKSEKKELNDDNADKEKYTLMVNKNFVFRTYAV